MTLLEREPTEGLQDARSPVLRDRPAGAARPAPDDAKAIKALINDRRIAEMTARIPHPYTLKDAKAFIATASGGRQPQFVDHARRRADRRRLRHRHAARRRSRDRLLDRRPALGQRLRHRSRPRLIDHAFGDLDYEVLRAGARVTNPASRRVLEKCGFQWTGVVLQRVRRAQFVGAVGPVPARSRPVGIAAELGQAVSRSIDGGANQMPAPFTIIGLDHVVLRARDPAALEKFYVEVLGCSLELRQGNLAQLRAGRTLIDIVPDDAAVASTRMAGANLDHLCLRVEPFDAAAIARHLAAHGVAVRRGSIALRRGRPRPVGLS